MKSKTKFIVVTFLTLSLSMAFSGPAGEQSKATDWSGSLISLFARSAQARDEMELFRLNDSIADIVREFVKTDSVFDYNFRNVRYLGQITSPDSLVKFITWNQRINDRDVLYNLFLITRDSVKGKCNSAFLKTLNGKYQVNEVLSVNEKNWYGALYYDIRPFETEGRKYYILLGLDLFSPEITRKVVEIAHIEKGRFNMGFPLILQGEKSKNRLLFNYSSSVSMTMRFHSPDTIVFDHLSPRDSTLIGDYRYYGPDFSYDALIFDGGKWVKIEDFDARNREIQR